MFIGPLRMARNGLLTEQQCSEPSVTFTVQLGSCELPSKVRSIGTLLQHHLSCGCPTEMRCLQDI